MKNILKRGLSVLLALTMVLGAIQINGFVGIEISDWFSLKAQAASIEAISSEINSDGETTEALRMPVEMDSYSEPEVAGKLVDVNQYSKVYKTGENTYSSVYTAIPNFYYDDKGNEQKYDNSLNLERKVGPDEFKNKSSDIDVSLSTDLAKNGITFEHEGVKVTLTPTEGNFDTYLISDNSVRYNNVFEGVDVQYTIDELGVHEYIILNNIVEKNSFSYKIKSNGNKIKLIDNVIYVYEGKDTSEYAYTISAPVMTDAAGVSSGDIKLSLKGDKLTITADKEWLSDSQRAYPVYIDPDIKIDSGLAVRSVVENGDRVYISATPYAYGYAGYIEGANFGFSGNLGRSKILVHINNGYFDNIPDGAGIISASFNIYQYVKVGGSNTNFWCSMITDSWNINDFSQSNQTRGYTRASALNSEFLSSSQTQKGWHSFDVRTAVNNWVNNLTAQNGFMITGQYNTSAEKGGAFVTNTSTGSTEGVGAYAGNKPYLIVNWEIPNPVDPNYPLNNTTINLRTIGRSTRDGQLAMLGVFADGVAKPNSLVNYVFSDSSAENQTYSAQADISYKYPDTTAWNSAFGERATKYKDILSNWQTAVPFTKFEYNKVYNWTASATYGGATGNVVKSPDFLVYKITRFDTLASIAKHYGVSIEQLALDNHVQDMLLVENNTIIVINPTQNATIPYNPGELTTSEKQKIDGLLMGRGKHCEFGFEPVNLNTGNFYMNQTDISIPDFNGNFEISRTYNSKGASINSAFGRGWQFNYSENISKLSNGDIAYRRGDGSTVYFTYENGRYTCTPGYYLELTSVAVGTKYGDFGGEEKEEYTVYEYEIKNSDGEIRRFSSAGLLKAITDKKGFVTTLNYDENFNLASLVSPAGTIYNLKWDAAGHITQIVVPNGSTINYEYDSNGNLVSYKNEVGDEIKYNYDSSHKMVSWVDGEGNKVVSNVYDNEGRVTKQTDSEGDVTIFEYGPNYTKTTDANGNSVRYNYDDNYRTTSIDYPDGSAEYKYYDSDNNLSKVISREGQETSYEYNADGFLKKQIRYDGKAQSYSYDSNNNIVQFIDFDGKAESFTYDSKGNVLTTTKKDTTVKKFEYDNNCRLVKLTDENGNLTTYSYDGIWVSNIIYADGSEEKFYYNANGQVVTKIDALGNSTRYFFDAAGRNLGYQSADDSVVSYTYNKAGCMVSLKDANGHVYTYEYDGIGNIISLTDPLSNEVVYTYDGLYNNTSVAYDNDHKTYQKYDAFSQTVKSIDEEGNTTVYTYDKAGNKTSVTDSNGNVTSYEYDYRFNKVSKTTDPLGNITTYTYDDIGNLVKTVAANGAVTEYKYDSYGRIVETDYDNGLIVTNSYDKAGNLIATKSNAGDNTTYVLDDVYNVLSVTYSTGAVLKYTYDANGNVLTEKDSNGATTKYTYDKLGRKSSVEDAVGRKTIYEYDGNGNVLSETTSNGGVTKYVYDALDRVRLLTDALGNSTVMEYDNVGNMVSTTNAQNEKTSYSYNKTGLVTKTVDPLGGILTLSYDKNGNLVNAVDAGGYKAEMSYDALNRISKTKDALGLVTTYSYDSVGNLITEKDNNHREDSYEYNKSNNLVKSTDSLGNATTYSYDLKGNLLSVTDADGSNTSYSYDTLGNLTSMVDALNGKIEYKYDIVGNLVSKIDQNGAENKYTYDLAGRMLSQKDAESQETKYEYNEFDFITKTIDANGNKSTAEYDLGGNLVSETDQNGNKTKYTYDKVYRLLSVVYADGTTTKNSYDANGNITSSTDQNNNVTKYTYDALGNIVKSVDPNGGETSYTYDAAGNVLTVKNALGNVTANTYDISSQLIKTVLANGATYSYAYDSLGRTVKENKPEGLSTEYKYDAVGNVTEKIDQSGRKTAYSYDALRRLMSTVDAKGNKTKFAYDKLGNLTSLITPNGNVTTYRYDAISRLVEVENPLKVKENYAYDGVGNLLSVTYNGKRTTSYAYDKVGNLTKVKNALGNKKSLSYDSLNRLTSESDFKGKKSTYVYDGNGNITSFTDRKGNTTNYTFDKLNNLLSEVDAEGRNKKYTYDGIGQLTSVTEADSATSTYEYDSVGNLISAGGYTYTYNLNGETLTSTDALGNVTEYAYNANGMLSKMKNADGSSVSYNYDEIDELVSKKYDDSQAVALYGYDADGNRVSMEDIAGTTDYEYDSDGKVTAINLYDGKSKITYSYNAYGELEKLGYPDGTAVTYSYDDLGQLVSISNRDGKKTAYKYDANGNVTEVHRPNNTYTAIKYDKNDQVSKLTNYVITKFFLVFKRTSVVSEYEYEYDKSGNIIEEDYHDFSSYGEAGFFTRLILKLKREYIEFSYKYDGRNQLVGVTETKHTLFKKTKVGETTYKYDVSGNKIQANEKGTVTDYLYNAAGQLVRKTSKGDIVNYTYDANGNLIKEENNGKLCAKYTKDYTYNNENRLTAVKNNGKLLMAALYDGDNERIFVVSDRDGCGLPCVNDKNCRNLTDNENGIDFDEDLIMNTMLIPNGVTCSLDLSNYDFTGYINNINSEYTQVLMEFGANNKFTAAYEYGVFRESAEIEGKDYFYEYDGRGSVIGLANSNGKERANYTYDPYGNTKYSGLSIANPYQYNAEYTDDATDLQYLRARYYRAETGSFITADTYAGKIANPLSLNRYTYVHNNPIMGKDPSGQFALAVTSVTVLGKAILATLATMVLAKEAPRVVESTATIVSGLGTVASKALNGVRSYYEDFMGKYKSKTNELRKKGVLFGVPALALCDALVKTTPQQIETVSFTTGISTINEHKYTSTKVYKEISEQSSPLSPFSSHRTEFENSADYIIDENGKMTTGNTVEGTEDYGPSLAYFGYSVNNNLTNIHVGTLIGEIGIDNELNLYSKTFIGGSYVENTIHTKEVIIGVTDAIVEGAKSIKNNVTGLFKK